MYSNSSQYQPSAATFSADSLTFASALLPQTINIDELAKLLGLSKWTIYCALTYRPYRIPPPIARSRKKQRLAWILVDVLAWMRGQYVAEAQNNPTIPEFEKRIGRPTKAEQIRRRGAAATGKAHGD